MLTSRKEVMRDLETSVTDALPQLLRSSEENWQASDFLPDFSKDTVFQEVAELQTEAKGLPEDLFASLVGNTITEEALPTYASWIFSPDGVGPLGGKDRTPWSAWGRAWCAEEKRHGDVLNGYLKLSGRVNVREVEITIQHLIRDGMDFGSGRDPYRIFVYTSFQAVATRVSHLNTAKLAKAGGAPRLELLCRRVSGDEGRHARAYQLFFSMILERAPEEALLAFQDMMKKQITMPAMNMRESYGEAGDLFDAFTAVAQRTGIYTTQDYLDILRDLLKTWDIEHMTGVAGEAAKAQDYLCSLPDRYERLSRRRTPRTDNTRYRFKWLKV